MSTEYSLIDECIVASDVNSRDGIGVQIYQDNDLILEVFRDDTKKTREVTLYEKDVSLELVEQSIKLFKESIPWEFLD